MWFAENLLLFQKSYTATRKLNFSEAAGISIYPNPAAADQLLTIKNASIAANHPVHILFINSAGQIVWEKEIVATVDGSVALNIPDIPAGAYLLLVKAGIWSDSKKILVAGR